MFSGKMRRTTPAHIDIRESAAYALVTSAISICINRARFSLSLLSGISKNKWRLVRKKGRGIPDTPLVSGDANKSTWEKERRTTAGRTIN